MLWAMNLSKEIVSNPLAPSKMLRFEKSKMCADQTYNVLTLQNKPRFAGGDFHETKCTIISQQISVRLQQNTNSGKMKATRSFDGIESEGT
jgi:hypothetical protein